MNAQAVIDIAKKEIGYKEGTNNATKYGQAFGLDHVAWCCISVWWCFWKAGLQTKIIKTAGVEVLENWGVKNKLTVPVANIQPGDLILCDFTHSGRAEHIEIATSTVDANRMVRTIGGNTSNPATGSQANGDGVYAKIRPTSCIKTVVRPQY
jgi:hypothetical protein